MTFTWFGNLIEVLKIMNDNNCSFSRAVELKNERVQNKIDVETIKEPKESIKTKPKMEKVYLDRFKGNDKQTLGEMLYKGKVIAKTLELAWKNNEKQMSCIPIGTYKVVRRFTPKFGNHFWLQDVPNRSYILIHKGNYHFQILGCILVGKQHLDINHDGYQDVTASTEKMKELLNTLPLEFELVIT